jgi:hypothetical protein
MSSPPGVSRGRAATSTRTGRAGSSTRAAAPFGTGRRSIAQDGDEEGVARLHDLPAPEQAAVIREALGIRKRVAVSTDQRSRLRRLANAFGFGSRHHREAVSAARIGESEAG